MENTIKNSPKASVIDSKTFTDTSHLADKTLAQQIADNEQQMYLKSQQHIQEIEDEVFFNFFNFTKTILKLLFFNFRFVKHNR